MKVITSSYLRAIIAIAIGILLIQYREETMTWLTMIVGGLFFISGVVSCIAYYFEKEKVLKYNAQIPHGSDLKPMSKPIFPFVGVGSIVLGVILANMPDTFLVWVARILAAFIILGAINQFVSLASARHFARVPILFWLFPLVSLGIGIFIVAKPLELATLPLLLVGWCLVYYGVVEILNTLKIYQMRKHYEKAAASTIVQGTKVIEDRVEEAEIIEEERK